MFGILPKGLKKGTVVTIYEDVKSRTIPEGDAILCEFIYEMNYFECWDVEFLGEPGKKLRRKIRIEESGQ